MKIRLKKIVSLFFLLLGFMPCLFAIVFSIRQEVIRHEMEEKLEEAIPHRTVSVPDHAIHWVKKGKEIWIHGKMFDIKTYRSHNGITTFTGLYDEDETLLKQQLRDGWEKNSKDNNILLMPFLLSFYNISDPHNNAIHLLQKEEYSWMNREPLSQYISILTPPPRG